MRLKIIFTIIFLIYQNNSYSKATDKNHFNQKYLSSYFSALVSSDNQKNDDALKFFNSSKFLVRKYDNFLKEYIFSLVLDGQIKKAVKEAKHSNNVDFFEANLLLVLESLSKNNYLQAKKRLKSLLKFEEDETYKYVIVKSLESYNYLFLNKEIKKKEENFGKIDLITSAFQNCYLNFNKSDSSFLNLINSPENDYSRYLFFYLANKIKNKEYEVVNKISNTIEPINSSLLIAQVKKWIEEKNYNKFNDFFSCNDENDLLAEFFFLIANLYSSQDKFKESNFYLNISNYLNPKFYFNLSLIAENSFSTNNFELTKRILNKFKKEDKIYDWFRIKRNAQILKKQKNNDISLSYIEKKIKDLNYPSKKILFDIANIYKSFQKYEKAIEYYSTVLSKVDKNSLIYADVLYRRGGAYERLEDYEKADIDLLNSLEINPEDPYTLNYLAYSWLERNYKLDKAMIMLEKAYSLTDNDPYITDSVGWAYYILGDYEGAEKYLRKAVELMPYDPIVNDHYGDVLWQLNRKVQAKYFWENVLELEDTEEKMKKNIKNKLLNGPNKI